VKGGMIFEHLVPWQNLCKKNEEANVYPIVSEMTG